MFHPAKECGIPSRKKRKIEREEGGRDLPDDAGWEAAMSGTSNGPAARSSDHKVHLKEQHYITFVSKTNCKRLLKLYIVPYVVIPKKSLPSLLLIGLQLSVTELK